MKIRNGFVSNSSTSSFILVGYKIKNADYKKYKGMDLNWVDDDDYDNYSLIGEEIANWNEEDPEIKNIKFEEINQIKEEIKLKMNMNEEPRLFGGIRQS